MIIDSSLHVNIILLVSGLQFFSRSVITTASISIAFAEFCVIVFWNIIPNKIKEKLLYLLNNTRPKLKFPTCPVYQNMTFPHISYTYLAEDRAKFYENK